MTTKGKYALPSRAISYSIAALRIVVGWHFLYEGFSKLLTPGWSSASYMHLSAWIFAPFFHWIAETPFLLGMADTITVAGTIFVGLTLLFGFIDRMGAIAGMFFLALFWLANPPLVATGMGVPTEGNYLLVDKNVVEFFALLVLAIIPTGKYLGLAHLLPKNRGKKTGPMPIALPVQAARDEKPGMLEKASLDRRTLLRGLAVLPVAGVFGLGLLRKRQWQSYEEQNLVDAQTGASAPVLNISGLNELEGTIPKGIIKDTPFSRLILGGNLLSGWAHSRDLIYVSSLVKAYHQKEKIFATLYLAEKCGVDTLLTNPILCSLIEEYWKKNIGKIQFISDCAGLNYGAGGVQSPMPFDEYLDKVKLAIDTGAVACYIQGETADYYMKNGQEESLAKVMDFIRQNNVLCGIGAHHIETLKACVNAGFETDFWMKTFHHHNYWSARHPEWHDNKYCFDPEETKRFMNERPEPFIAFKVMAAGAIHPRDGFRYAFENGADFVCAGMYDFQMVEDVNIALSVLGEDLTRERPWRA